MKNVNLRSPGWDHGRKYFYFVIPALVVYCVFSVYPLFSSFYYSMTNWDGYSVSIKYIGLANYKYLFQDKRFAIALQNTLKFVVLDVLLENGLGLINALMLESRVVKGKKTLRGLFFVPVILPAIVVAFIWSYIYSFNGGFINVVLEALGASKIDFIGDGRIAIYFVILTGIWQWMSYRMVIYISGIQNIPTEIYEAAEVDGVNRFQRLKNITMPLLMPSFKINMTLCMIGALKQFDIVFAMTNGGPGNATEVIATKIFHEAFSASDYGYGCAIGVVLFLFILIVTILFNRFFDKKEVDY